MHFHSYSFLVFFLAVLGLYQLPLGWAARRGILLVASYAFYAAWNPWYLGLLWVSTAVDWVVARRIHASQDPAARRGWLWLSLAVNLGMLGVFKYGDLLLGTAAQASRWLGWGPGPETLGFLLPVGISFYTFQTLSYTLDVYRGTLAPAGSLLDYALYVTFFPQLVAGPIVRAADFLPQCEAPRVTQRDRLGWGLALMVWGLFLKAVLSDAFLAPSVQAVYDAEGVPGSLAAWLATLGFTAQIYFDFAGYSTIAIGAAMTMGFALPDNFRAPFASVGFGEFWRRWHLSFSTWLRDYLFTPLARGLPRTWNIAGAVFLTMVLGGLWHGASWAFAYWGALHGLMLVLDRPLVKRLYRRPWARRGAGRLVLAALTFAVLSACNVFFRAPRFGRAFEVLLALAGQAPEAEITFHWVDAGLVGAVVLGTLLAHHLVRDDPLEDLVRGWSPAHRALVLTLLLYALLVIPGDSIVFAYFQF